MEETYHSKVCRCFIWYLFETSWRSTDGFRYVFLRRHHDFPTRRRGEVPLTHLGNVPLSRRWVFHLRRHWDVQRDATITFLQRLVAGWVITKVVLISFSASISLEFWSVNHTSIYKNSKLKVFKNNFFGETSNNWPNNLLGTNVTNV